MKISTNDQGIIKVVDGAESAYKTDGKETATIIFTGGEGNYGVIECSHYSMEGNGWNKALQSYQRIL